MPTEALHNLRLLQTLSQFVGSSLVVVCKWMDVETTRRRQICAIVSVSLLPHCIIRPMTVTVGQMCWRQNNERFDWLRPGSQIRFQSCVAADLSENILGPQYEFDLIVIVSNALFNPIFGFRCQSVCLSPIPPSSLPLLSNVLALRLDCIYLSVCKILRCALDWHCSAE